MFLRLLTRCTLCALMCALCAVLTARAAIYASSTSNLAVNSVTLNATISGALLATNNFYFQIGPSASYGRNIASASTYLLAGLLGYFGVNTHVAALSCGTTYHWRVVQDNFLLGIYIGSTYGPDQAFTTLDCAAPATTATGAFTVFEGTVSNSAAATASNRIIQTRVAGSTGLLCTSAGGCGLKVAAMSNGTLNPGFSGTVTASLEACANVSRNNGVVCGGSWLPIAGTSQAVALVAGVGALSLTAVPDAYEVVRVKVVSTSPALTAYGEDYFAIRPASLALAATDANASTAGSTRSLTSTLLTHKAGQPFSLTAQALGTAGAVTGRYPGSAPGPVLQSLATLLPLGGVNGSLGMGVWAASGVPGTVSSTATYDEVGTIGLSLQDQNFADVDASDTPAVQRYFSGSLAQVGRFTPDHLVTELTPACVAGAFTYSGQPFAVKVTAQNASLATTRNYTGTQAANQTLSVVTPEGLGVLANTTLLATNFVAGVATSNQPVYTFTQAATPPQTLSLRSTDSDGISSSGFSEGSTSMRSGRLRMSNALGSELLALPLTLRVESYNAGWSTHTADTCTSLNAANLAWTAGSSGSRWQACESAVTLGGSSPNFSAIVSAPGAGNQGWADVTLLLGNSGTGGACTSVNAGSGYSRAAVPAMQPWLQFNWRGTVGNPSARLSFGQYNSRMIDLRENF